MVEPLLHLAIPLASLGLVGLDRRKILVACAAALVPDLDALFYVHRSFTHSVVVLAVIAIPALVLTRKHRGARLLILLASYGVLTHLVLDMFSWYTPLLWPVVDDSLRVSAALDIHLGSPPLFTWWARVQLKPTIFEPFASLDAPILTAPGLFAFSILLIPILFLAKSSRAR